MEWSFTGRVSEKRQELLQTAPKFECIIKRILGEMEPQSFSMVHGEIGVVKGCVRPEFQLRVHEETFDLFFNSQNGYRGKFRVATYLGESTNATIISAMTDKLVNFASEHLTSCSVKENDVLFSLSSSTAKIWIDEEGQRAQKSNDILYFNADLLVELWYGTALKYISSPGEFPDINSEIKSVDGIKAPQGTILTVKGGFIDIHDNECIPVAKTNRSEQIHLFGFT